MARDEALLAACIDATTTPLLRFYAWSSPTISLGYFQGIEEFEALPEPAGRLDVVRRTTGGGAILHDLEVTYSLTLPLTHPLVDGRPNELYTFAHDAVIEAVGGDARRFGCDQNACGASAHRGPFFCFARRHALDVVIPDDDDATKTRKLAGSAQRRTQTAILQHGSIMLDSRFNQQPLATWRDVFQGAKSSADSPLLIDDSGESHMSFTKAVERLVKTFADKLNFEFEISRFTDAEQNAADQFEQRYASDAWTRDRVRDPR